MARWRTFAWVSLLLAAGGAAAQPAGLGLGRPATPAEIAAWSIAVRPDGQGLPAGKGSVAEGEQLYLQHCAACHGEFGEGAGRFPALMSGQGSLRDHDPVKTIGSYWPYATTVWDYVFRSMPFGNAQSLTADETYAVVAYLLHLNDVVDADFVADAKRLPAVRLPNAAGFFELAEPDLPRGEPCMRDCAVSTRVIGRARAIDVTPERRLE
ncbi:MAG: cytochrome c [Alphaproteobacteria bacterium]|nr:cytochrome c [Alphaproteobacteria bacterium]